MPYKPRRPCKAGGCPRVTDNVSGYCDIHKHLVPERPRGNSPHSHLYGTRWHKARRQYLTENPLCVKCGARATVVDHITPHNGDMALFWSKDNWSSLCAPCHDSKTAKEMNQRK